MTIEETMNIPALPNPAGHEPASVAVDAAKLRDLSDRYVLYREALVEPGDPVRMMNATGAVLAAVRGVLTDPDRGIRR